MIEYSKSAIQQSSTNAGAAQQSSTNAGTIHQPHTNAGTAQQSSTNAAAQLAGYTLDAIHLFLVFFPLLLFLIPPASTRPWLKYVFPAYILIPLHWGLFENQCLFTIWSIQLGTMEHQGHDSSFSETYLRWFYEPLINAAGYSWKSSTLDKAIYLHWAINFILMSIYTFGFVYIEFVMLQSQVEPTY